MNFKVSGKRLFTPVPELVYQQYIDGLTFAQIARKNHVDSEMVIIILKKKLGKKPKPNVSEKQVKETKLKMSNQPYFDFELINRIKRRKLNQN